MAVRLADHMMSVLEELRYQPTVKRVRVELAGVPVADTVAPVLVWEPMRIVPAYAVPERDVIAALSPTLVGSQPAYEAAGFGADSPPLLTPAVPFAVHTTTGDALTVTTTSGERRESSAFRFGDELPGYIGLDFDAFDWWEEDVRIVGHPRDPFHRIDVRPSSRSVRIEHQGHVLADSTRPFMLFEGTFPLVRYYLPRSDVRVELAPGTSDTTCAYKGHATHYSTDVGDDHLPNIAWSYEEPLEDATQVCGLVSFYQERLDLFVDDVPVSRVRTPWS